MRAVASSKCCPKEEMPNRRGRVSINAEAHRRVTVQVYLKPIPLQLFIATKQLHHAIRSKPEGHTDIVGSVANHPSRPSEFLNASLNMPITDRDGGAQSRTSKCKPSNRLKMAA